MALFALVGMLHGVALLSLNVQPPVVVLPPVTVAVKIVTAQADPLPETQPQPQTEAQPRVAAEAAAAQPDPAPQQAVPPEPPATQVPVENQPALSTDMPVQDTPLAQNGPDMPTPPALALPSTALPVIETAKPDTAPVTAAATEPMPQAQAKAALAARKQDHPAKVASVKAPNRRPPQHRPMARHSPPAQPAAPAHKPGAQSRAASPRGANSGMSMASYASLVLGQINAHKFYPAGAGGAGGQVVFSFSIGPSGRVSSFAITRSSGNAALDRAASAAVHAIHVPSPPGGHFAGASVIVFGR